MEKLTVNIEDIDIYDIETCDEEFEPITEEEEKANAEFLDRLGEHCASLVRPCECNAHKFMERQITKARILQGSSQQVIAAPDQELIDGFKFSAILVLEKDKYKSVSAVIKECRNCHKIEYYGDSSVFSQLIAESTVNRMSIENQLPADDIQDIDVDELKDIIGGDISFIDVNDHNATDCESCGRCKGE